MNEFIATTEQRKIIDADLGPLAVVACPGSGKTATAVRRLAEVRRRLAGSRGHVALLSYSNVAVDTFRIEYQRLRGGDSASDRVVIQTVDSFIATFLLRPHGARAMRASRTPFLVLGGEPFLSNYKFGDQKNPIRVEEIILDRESGKTVFYRKRKKNYAERLDDATTATARSKIIELAKVGGYTYALGRAWALKTLQNEPKLMAALARRFPQILVDEAQDIGSFEGEVLDLLSTAGSVVTLIGDFNQSIYGFNFATGAYLREFSGRSGIQSLPLTQNRRSLECIVSVANALAKTDSKPFRTTVERLSGAYYWRYDIDHPSHLMSAWATALSDKGYQLKEATVLYRGESMLSKMSLEAKKMGQSAVKHFAAAAVERDQGGDIAKVLDHCAKGVLHVVEGLPETFIRDLKGMHKDEGMRTLRRLVWRLIRSPDHGIPLATLPAKSNWLPALKNNLTAWFDLLESQTSYRRISTLSARMKSTKLPDFSPLLSVDFSQNIWAGLRCGTVHSAKGESIPAVMYLTSEKNLSSMLAGTDDEEGRIGFVAATRACDLLVVAIPSNTTETTVQSMIAKGFSDWEHPM